MLLTQTYCAECKMYLGLQDAHGELDKSFLMPHLPGCRIGDKEREAIERELEPRRL